MHTKFLSEKSEWKRPFGKPRHSWEEDSINMDVKE
jgi:hypothetical protein